MAGHADLARRKSVTLSLFLKLRSMRGTISAHELTRLNRSRLG
jgi:hypothetical protein